MPNIDKRQGYDPVPIQIYDRKNNTVFKEISLIAFDKRSDKVLATGNDVLPLMNVSENNIVVLCPLKGGFVADYIPSKVMFQDMLQRASLLKRFIKPKIAVCVPAGITEVERKAVEEIFRQLGARELTISEEPAGAVNKALNSSYGILVSINPDNESDCDRKETWREVSKNTIPPDDYHLASIKNHDEVTSVSLNSSTRGVELKFHKAFAIRIIAKDAVPDGLYSEDELKKFREGRFENTIYEITGGEFNSSVTDSLRGKAMYMSGKHYIVVCDDELIEVLAERKPEILTLPNLSHE